MAEGEKTTSNTPVSEIDPGGTRPAPKKAPENANPQKQPVQSGDQNSNPPRGTDR